MPQSLTPPTFDWIQLSVFTPPEFPTDFHKDFTLKIRDTGSKIFTSIADIYIHGYEIATIAYKPRSNILPKQFALLKYNNQYLYTNNINTIIHETLSKWKMKFKGNTRLDICIDFNVFANNLTPENFIKRIVNNRYIRKGKSQFNIHGRQHIYTTLTGIKFGSETTTVSAQLYNKSLEMREQKLKPWIHKYWDIYKMPKHEDIYRLEFSIKASSKNMVNVKSGEIENIYTLQDYSSHYAEQLLYTCIQQYFTFVINNKQARKDRMTELRLFDTVPTETKLITLPPMYSSNRMDKYIYKSLKRLNDEARENKLLDTTYIEEVIKYFKVSRGLEDNRYIQGEQLLAQPEALRLS